VVLPLAALALPASTAFELAKLADLHDRGVITDAEFAQRKDDIQG